MLFSPCSTDLDARPWDFQTEEVALRTRVEQFNARRYDETTEEDPSNDVMSDLLQKVDNNPLSCLGQDVTLPHHFKENYESWLENEVFRPGTCLPDLDESGLLVKGKLVLESDEDSPWPWVRN